MKHPYADILIAIAEGKEIQWQDSIGEWTAQTASQTLYEIKDSDWNPKRYRVKPAMIIINGVECVAPEGCGCYAIHIQCDDSETENNSRLFKSKNDRDAAYAALIKPFEDKE